MFQGRRLAIFIVFLSQVYLSALAGLVICISPAVHTQIETVSPCCVSNRPRENLLSLVDDLSSPDCVQCSDIPLWGGSYLPTKPVAVKLMSLEEAPGYVVSPPLVVVPGDAADSQLHRERTPFATLVTSQLSPQLLC